ncbi:TRAP transporter large permease subunit [Escherichia coli]|nr:TRAP transporter large permease subunit [Escherichia coli]NZA86878.1 TRAP transporter large permease subunit [Escherichia coli]
MTTVYVSEENLKSLVHHKLHTAGLDADTAQQVTDVLVHADITGVHSHGVMRVEHYCTRLAAGGLNKAPQFSIEQISPSVAILDSDDGMGHSALISATEHAIKLAQQEGLGFVSVKNTSHCGALSYFAEMITNKGLVAIVMTQTDTCVAPHGGAERFLGTNPIAFGFPVENSHPMIVDMATRVAGNIMNTGGIARRLVNLAQALVGRLPGSLAHCNILANTLFGAISGSAVASAAAVGGIMSPLQEKEGYDPAFSAAVNIASAPIGLMIPPSNVLIVYSLASGGTSVAALFLAGYLPGILTAVALMFVAALYARRHHYPVAERINYRQFLQVFRESIPSLMLIFIIIGGIIAGVFTPTEASAIAVIYSLALAMIYREITLKKLNDILLDSVVTSSIVLLLVGCSMGMSWAMTNADVPELINELITRVSDNKWVILFIINIILLIVGTFMDITPAILIFTPIFLPIAQHLGIDPIHFGIIMVFNLTIGLCTPPVGTILFVGCSIGKVSIDRAIKPLLPMFLALFVVMAIICYFPQLSLMLPGLFST